MQGWAVIAASAFSRMPKLRTVGQAPSVLLDSLVQLPWERAPAFLLDSPNRPSRLPCPSLLVQPHSSEKNWNSAENNWNGHSAPAVERSFAIDTACQIVILSRSRSLCSCSRNGAIGFGNAFSQVIAEVTYFANGSALPTQTTYRRVICPHDLPNPCSRMDARRFGSMAEFAVSRGATSLPSCRHDSVFPSNCRLHVVGMEEQHQPTGFAHCWNGRVFIVRCLERDHASRLGGKHSPKRIGLQRHPLEFVFLDGCGGGSLRAMEYIGRDLERLSGNSVRGGEGGVRSKTAGQVERSQASVPHVFGWMRIACLSNLDHADSCWVFKCIHVSLVSYRTEAVH